MTQFVILLSLIFTLAGCGAGDRVAPWRSVLVNKSNVCFSMDKRDILSRYNISSVQNDAYKEFATNQHVSLSFPQSCLKLALIPGYTYGVSYTLNSKNYRYVFFIDNDWNVKSTFKE